MRRLAHNAQHTANDANEAEYREIYPAGLAVYAVAVDDEESPKEERGEDG